MKVLTSARHVGVAHDVDVNAPIEKVWDALVAWETQDQWMLGTAVIVPVGATRAGVGAQIEAFTGAIPKKRLLGFLDTMTVTTWDPPVRCDVLHTGRVVRGTGAFVLEPISSTQTRFHWSEELRLPLGILGRIGWIFVGPVMMAGVRWSLRRFARYVVG